MGDDSRLDEAREKADDLKDKAADKAQDWKDKAEDVLDRDEEHDGARETSGDGSAADSIASSSGVAAKTHR
jgi:hypothetical protein